MTPSELKNLRPSDEITRPANDNHKDTRALVLDINKDKAGKVRWIKIEYLNTNAFNRVLGREYMLHSGWRKSDA